MKKPQLSAAQASIVVALRQGVKLHWMFGINAHAWLEQKGMPGVTHSALALERKGVIERHDITHAGCLMRLTELGKSL